MELSMFTQKLEERLETDLPGKNSQFKFRVKANQPYNFNNTEKEAIPSAVLILLYEKDGELHFILTERTQTVDSHKGQISLPGGAQEDDEVLSQTAKRETHEEIGIDPSHVNVIGELSPLFVPVTGFLIYPFIGSITQHFDIVIAENEVEAAFSVRLLDLMDDAVEKKEKRELRGFEVEIPYFLLDGKKVWGATAMILSEFKQVLMDIS